MIVIGIMTVASICLYAEIQTLHDDIYRSVLLLLFIVSCLDFISTVGTSVVNSNRIHVLFEQLDEIDALLNKAIDRKQKYLKDVKRGVMMACSIGVAFVIVSIFIDFPIQAILERPLEKIAVWYFFKVIWFIVSDLRLKMFCTFSVLIMLRYRMLNEIVDTDFKNAGKRYNFEEVRRIHSAITSTLHSLDKIFNPDILTSLVAAIVHTVVLLFLSSSMKKDNFQEAHHLDWFFCKLTFTTLGSIILLRTIGAAYVGDQVSKAAKYPLSRIHDMDTSNYGTSTQFQLILFCNQMHTRQLCPTAAGFFNFNKQMVCTIVSILLTYIVILVQLRGSIAHTNLYEEATRIANNLTRTIQNMANDSQISFEN
ncbi:uncharacterized protein LOC136026787 isoform X1 [Artemia franciscana]